MDGWVCNSRLERVFGLLKNCFLPTHAYVYGSSSMQGCRSAALETCKYVPSGSGGSVNKARYAAWFASAFGVLRVKLLERKACFHRPVLAARKVLTCRMPCGIIRLSLHSTAMIRVQTDARHRIAN